jgi:CHAD domain-containing protein
MEPYLFFELKFRKLVVQIRKRLDAYIENPEDPKRVHDIRTSLRRLDTLFPLLSKKNRKANKKRISEYRDFFKTTSQLRDYDIIMARLGALSPRSKVLTGVLRERKDSELKAVVKKARKLRKEGKISIQSLTSQEIEARLDKVLGRLADKIRINLAVALADSNNVEQLHTLRKNFKKIRYILEALDSRAAKKYQKMLRTGARVALSPPVLEELQDMLGDLHDSDITLEFLESSNSSDARVLYPQEAKIRKSLYDNFIKYVNSILSADNSGQAT